MAGPCGEGERGGVGTLWGGVRGGVLWPLGLCPKSILLHSWAGGWGGGTLGGRGRGLSLFLSVRLLSHRLSSGLLCLSLCMSVTEETHERTSVVLSTGRIAMAAAST